jgi:hypothetical protein
MKETDIVCVGVGRRVMSKCKEDKCVNEVDVFYYCDDHFKGEDNE